MAKRLPFSGEQYWNACMRNAYKGAKMWTYEAGTRTILKTTWTTADESIEHENPIEADAEGIFPEIYGKGSYFIKITNFSGSELVYEADNINGSRPIIDGSVINVENVATMKGLDLSVGDWVEWFEYYEGSGTGGNAGLVVPGGTGVPDDGSFFDLDNGLQVKAVFNNPVKLKQFGAVGNYDADDTDKIDNFFRYISNLREGFIDAGNYGYTGSLNLPAGVKITGSGAHTINTFITTDDKRYLRSGYKHLISGSNFIFKVSANQIYNTNRSDKFQSISYCAAYLHLEPMYMYNIGMILDVDVYNLAGNLTTRANDNQAAYEAGLILRSQLSEIENCNFFGYWNKTSLIVHSQQNLENVDSDYNRALRTNFTSIALIGDSTQANGLTGFYGLGCGYYNAADYHDVDEGNYDINAIFIDGNNGIAGIRGHKFDGNIRTRANEAVKLDHANDITFDFYTIEVPTVAGVPGADTPGKYVVTENTKDIFMGYGSQNSTAGMGINDVANTISGSLISIGAEDNKTLLLSSDSDTLRMYINDVGDSLIQFTDDPTDINSGLIFGYDKSESNLAVKSNSLPVITFDSEGNIQSDGFYRFSDDVDIRSGSDTNYIRMRFGNDSAFVLDPTIMRTGLDGDQDLGSSNFRFKSGFFVNPPSTTSDERLKTPLKSIDDRIMKAWANVKSYQFKLLESITRKGSDARIHFGYSAQQVIEAFKNEGLDAFDYALIRTVKTFDSEHYEMVYEECAILEAEYVRRLLTS